LEVSLFDFDAASEDAVDSPEELSLPELSFAPPFLAA
jgi:hypothetical protein